MSPQRPAAFRFLLLLLLLPAFSADRPARAQQPPASSPPLRVDVGLVNLEVAVTDAAGNFIPDLEAHNFRVREEGARQTIAHFAPTRAPVRILLLVEASPAVFLIRRDHLTAAFRLLEALRPEDEVALVSYARQTHQASEFTRDKKAVADRLASLGRFGLGMAEVNLFDAIADTLERLSPPPRRTAVLVIGTGLDSGSRASWAALERRVGSSQLTFFTLATGHLLRGEPDKAEKKSRRSEPVDSYDPFAAADTRLRALAQASAGQAYFPKSEEEMDHAYREIAERLRNLYSLGYYPAKSGQAAGYRTISVELVEANGDPLVLRDPKGNPIRYRIFARPGYFASGDESAPY